MSEKETDKSVDKSSDKSSIMYSDYLTEASVAKETKNNDDNKFLANGKRRVRRKRVSKNSELYINPDELLKELMFFKSEGIISEELGAMFIKLAIRYTSSAKFNGYSWRDEFISSSLLRIMKYIDNFDPYRPDSNAFAYFTEIIHNEVVKTIKAEKKLINTNNELRREVWNEIEDENGLEHVKLNNENEND